MTDLTWYSTSKANEVFATKRQLEDVKALGKGEKGDKGDPGIQGPPGKDGAPADLSGYLKSSDAAGTYATKNELAQAQVGSGAGAAPLAALPLQPGRVVPTVAFFGDSWSTESTMGQGFNLPAVASRILGCVPMVSAIDGSGFAYSASGSDGFEVDARVNAACAAVPNLIVTVGSLNADKVIDNGDATGSKITAAVQSFVTKVRAKLPQVPIVMVGPEPSSVSRLQSLSAHVNVKAQKAGVEAAGGLANGIAFVDWLGVADRQAVPWRDGRQCAEGDVVIYGGVAYRVTQAWSPAPGVTPVSAGAPTIQVSDVLSGTGNAGAPKGDGTRDTLLLSDDTHPTKIGAIAFGSALANRIAVAVASLASWAKAQGPVIPAAPAVPPTPQPQPGGDGLPIMAWLPGGWGVSDRASYSMTDLRAVAALKPDQVALPIQVTQTANDAAVAIPHEMAGNDGVKHKFSEFWISGFRAAGVDLAGMVEALDMFEEAGIQVLPNVRNGLLDAAAEYYTSSDGKVFTILAGRTGKTYSQIHGRGQNALRAIMMKDHATTVRVVDATDASADWQLSESVKDAQKGVLLATKAGANVWSAVKGAFPDGVWVVVSNKDEQTSAKSLAEAAGATIIGWAAPSAEALAAIKA